MKLYRILIQNTLHAFMQCAHALLFFEGKDPRFPWLYLVACHGKIVDADVSRYIAYRSMASDIVRSASILCKKITINGNYVPTAPFLSFLVGNAEKPEPSLYHCRPWVFVVYEE